MFARSSININILPILTVKHLNKHPKLFLLHFGMWFREVFDPNHFYRPVLIKEIKGFRCLFHYLYGKHWLLLGYMMVTHDLLSVCCGNCTFVTTRGMQSTASVARIELKSLFWLIHCHAPLTCFQIKQCLLCKLRSLTQKYSFKQSVHSPCWNNDVTCTKCAP